MMKVESSSQWSANTVSFVDTTQLYLRLAAEGQVVWYEMADKGAFVWAGLDTKRLDKAWANRNYDEDL